jgi:hypothetical protein
MLPDFRKTLAESKARRQKMLDNSRINLRQILDRNRERRSLMFKSITPIFTNKIAYVIYIILAIKLIYSFGISIIGLFN